MIATCSEGLEQSFYVSLRNATSISDLNRKDGPSQKANTKLLLQTKSDFTSMRNEKLQLVSSLSTVSHPQFLLEAPQQKIQDLNHAY